MDLLARDVRTKFAHHNKTGPSVVPHASLRVVGKSRRMVRCAGVPVQSEIFCVCNSAKNVKGVVTLTETYSKVGAEEFPVAQNIAVFYRVRLEPHEFGTHSMSIELINEQGKIGGPPATGTFVAAADGGHRLAWANGHIEIRGLKIAGPGEFLFRLLIDGQLVSTCILSVVKA